MASEVVHSPASGMTSLRALAADAVAQYRKHEATREAALQCAGHELEVLLQECAQGGIPVTGARAVSVARLTIGTYQTALDQAAGLARG